MTAPNRSCDEKHVCRCRSCDASLKPSDESRGVGHFGVNFDRGWTLDALKDGEIMHGCYEVITGPNGRAWRYSEPFHRCTCDPLGDGICAYIDRGYFSVAEQVGNRD